MAEVTDRLTYDALFEVLSRVSVSDLGRMAQVSNATRNAAEDQLVWRNRCRGLEVEWGKAIAHGASPCYNVEDAGMWKDLFRDEHNRLNTMSRFLGTWSEKWCDVSVVQSTQIETDGTNFIVSYKKNKFTAKFLSFDGQTLSFHLHGGDSGWSFVYTIKSISPNEPLTLTVLREHDKRTFSGTFHRTETPASK
eukprot:TRINITY_DN2063_c0_g1_i1.p1 TRINITY_DN2063_c0_g1~~TRINITY_DN2063_c0_g1_i1.p1  ORF type:complete len:193 (-),score=20.94 TRINITY_DN2063_c0_g1_i1:351-929(-)